MDFGAAPLRGVSEKTAWVLIDNPRLLMPLAAFQTNLSG